MTTTHAHLFCLACDGTGRLVERATVYERHAAPHDDPLPCPVCEGKGSYEVTYRLPVAAPPRRSRALEAAAVVERLNRMIAELLAIRAEFVAIRAEWVQRSC